jgi:fluoride exporter
VIWLAVAVAGALGASSRYLIDQAVTARLHGSFPWATVLINVTGSWAAGAVTGLAVHAVVPEDVRLVVAGGFLGAYTTFSTAMVESVRLLEEGATVTSLAALLVPLVLGVGAATAAFVLVA